MTNNRFCLCFMFMTVRALTSISARPRIAIIGAGAAGLSSARESLHNADCDVVVYEQRPHVGGIWRYDPNKESINHTAMYGSLRTNLPKECMAFPDFPFDDESAPMSFVSHEQVQEYLNSYKKQHKLDRYIQYDTRVKSVEKTSSASTLVPDCPTWKITTETNQKETVDIFDAVMVCNGHYHQPLIPDILGLDNFRGATMHSKDYDTPQALAQSPINSILCVGGRASGTDIARELSESGIEVFLSDSTCTDLQKLDDKLTHLPLTTEVDDEGLVHFKNVSFKCKPDLIMFCTGYHYQFPFLSEDLVSINGRAVSPLHQQLWHAEYTNLALIGLPHSVIPFPLFSVQARVVLASWKQESLLPPRLERLKDANEQSSEKDAHFLGDAQWDYLRMLARMGGFLDASLDNSLRVNQMLYEHSGGERKMSFPTDSYRAICYQRQQQDIQVFSSVETKRDALKEVPSPTK